ncbi:MAG: DUF2029 domain-containing protein [Candidatus Rokubacteria bacterium]|nr:DUF2029 domain-containing protein [Candidatus Rokubacteria bacterium]MBI3456120.1 DUF2029 domain-containing protein [Candidatus Rokubacteria bacterium]
MKREPFEETAAIVRGLKPVLWSVLLLYSVAHFAFTGVWAAIGVRGGDVLSGFPGPLVSGREEFAADTVAVQYPNPTWNYGPIAHFWTYPLGFVRSIPDAMRILLAVNYVLLGIAFLIWLGELSRDAGKGLSSAVMFVVWLNYFPLLQAIVGREFEILEFFLLSVGFYCLKRGREVVAGGMIGLAAMTKVLPALFVPYLVLKGRWRAAAASVVAIVVIGLVGQRVLGFEHSVTFRLARGWTSAADFEPHADNQAMANIVQRAFTTHINPRSPKMTPAFPAASRVLGGVAQISLLGFVLVWVWKQRRRPVNVWEYSILLMTMIVIPPWSNIYYLMFLVVPFSAGFVWLLGRGEARFGQLAVVAIAYTLTGYVVPISFMASAVSLSPVEMRNLLGHLSIPGVGMLILFATFWELKGYCVEGSCGSPQTVPRDREAAF